MRYYFIINLATNYFCCVFSTSLLPSGEGQDEGVKLTITPLTLDLSLWEMELRQIYFDARVVMMP